MNALGIILNNMLFGDLALLLYRFAFAVAAAADERDPRNKNFGMLIMDGQNIVSAVTAHATRGERITFDECLAVKAV